MPTYEYLCRDCGHGFDIVQAFKDETLTICPACGGVLRKVFAAPAISFKGSGFYATDSRKGSKSGSESTRDGSKHDGSKQERSSKDERSKQESSKSESSKQDSSTERSSNESSSKEGSSSPSSSDDSSSKPKETSKETKKP